MMKKGILLVLMLNCLQIGAQTVLNIPTQNRCSYSGTAWEDELYRFDNNAQVEAWIKEILVAGNAEQNFKIVPTNVENIAAIVDNGQRYLLFSLDFIQKATAIEVYGALAHEIGHHVNGHFLTADRRQIEESEADFFMGYVLFKLKTQVQFDKPRIEAFLQKLPSATPFTERRETVFWGYDKADNSLQYKSLQLENDPKLELLTLPTFEFKKCYATFDLDKNQFGNPKTLGKVDEQLRLALDKRGYAQRSYFSVKNGYAIMTQMEQFNKADATSRNDRTRWLEHPARDNFSGIMDYFTSVLMPNKGYFRLFVFVVTDNAFKSKDERVTKNEAAAWLSQGANRLPKVLADMPYTEGYNVSVLVYEFEVPESNRKAKQVCPTPKFDAKTHFKKAGFSF
jgi:hypothetical protein